MGVKFEKKKKDMKRNHTNINSVINVILQLASI